MDVVDAGDESDIEDEPGSQKPSSGKTPFEKLSAKMTDISPDLDSGVLKRVINNGSGLVIPPGSRVRSNFYSNKIFLSYC